MLSFSYMLLLLCATVAVVLSQKPEKESKSGLTVTLTQVLKDREFKAKHRFEQYKILEATYLMFAVENKMFTMSEYKSNKKSQIGFMKQSKPETRYTPKTKMIYRFG